MKLTPEEKNFVDKISAISGHDSGVVRDVFFALLLATTLEVYSGSNEIFVPYLFKVGLRYKKIGVDPKKKCFKVGETYNVTTSNSLHDILVDIVSNGNVWIEDYLKKEIMQKISSILEIDVIPPMMVESA